MNKLSARFGKIITASFFVMGIGLILLILVIPLYHFFNIDTDVIGLIILTAGLALLIVGIIRRKKPKGLILAILITLAVLLCIPLLSLIVSGIYVLISGNPM